MLKLNYYSHLLLNSPYRIIVICLVNVIIYLSFNYNIISHCMFEGVLPVVAEPKVPVIRGYQPMTPLQKEISMFLGYEDIIKEQKSKIEVLTLERDRAVESHKYLSSRIRGILQHDLDSNRLNNQRINNLTVIKTRQYHEILQQRQRIADLQTTNNTLKDINGLLVCTLFSVGVLLTAYVLYKNTGDVSSVEAWKRQLEYKISKL